MNIDDKISYWIELADYDLETADAMYSTKRFLYVGFMCHQIVEKLLKAYYVKSNIQDPPYTHNLRFLIEKSGLSNEIDDEKLLFVVSLQPMNIEGRYPTYKQTMLKFLTDEKCKNLIHETKEFSKWIKMKL